MKQNTGITKAELARQLGVSRAYITMIANGTRKPSQDIVNKLQGLGVNKLNVKRTSNPSWGINSVSGGFDPHPLPPNF
ncbi:MAG: helix-turn-helix transcriptional regulator [Dehalococcoidia bacterium]|nr:helix-turn-helix transcriptional regulator [Dehalococcoidia bacterium]